MPSSNRRLTLGFKLMSGFYGDRIGKDDVAALAGNDKVPWGTLKFEEMVNSMGAQLLKSPVFAYWNSWGFSMTELLSDAVALNFLLVSLKDWQRKDEPTDQRSGEFKQFMKNAIVLLDQSIYEYVTRQWRGAGDSKIAKNLEGLDTAPEVFAQVPEERWERLANEVVDEGKIEGQTYLNPDPEKSYHRSAKALLAYCYVIERLPAPSEVERPVEVDHIIPRSTFRAAGRPEIKILCHHIINLAFLPKTPNIAKSEKRLIDVPNGRLREQISLYTDIPTVDFEKYSDPIHAQELNDFRGAKIKLTLTTSRREMLGA